MMTWNSVFFHSPSTYMMELVISMHDYVMMFLCSIMFMVLMNLIYCRSISFFNHNFYNSHQLENIWTITPFIVLLLILVPSLTSLYMLDTCMFCGLSVSAVAHQWYWSYLYKDFDAYFFDSYMIPSEESSLRLLEVDNRICIANSLPVRFTVSSSDVIHSWTVPSLGVKMDAIPGRVNQFCFSIKRSGVFFGQCSEICGANHSFMPIVLESVPFKVFLNLF